MIDRLTVEEGLSQSDVKCLIQDSLGFLWVGTRDGLNRYDGYRFQTIEFDNTDSMSLGFNQISTLNLLPKGKIIIGSVGGFSVYDYTDRRFHNHYLDQADHNAIINDIAVVGDTAILATTTGLIFFDLGNKKYLRDNDPAISQRVITQVKVSPDRREWVGTSTGLFMRQSRGQSLRTIFNDKLVYHVNFDEGNVLVSTNRGLFEYTQDGDLVRQIPLLPEFSLVFATLRAANGELWVASHKVLIMSRDARTVTHVLGHNENNQRTLSEDRVRVLYETRDGTIWLGTFGYGLNKHNPSTRKISYLSEHSELKLSSDYVSAIYSADDTIVFVGTSRGLNIVDYGRQTVSIFNPGRDDPRGGLFLVYAIKAGHAGDLWMAALGGLYRWKNGSFVLQNNRFAEILDFVEYDSQSLLLLTRASGCYLYDKQTKRLSVFVPKSSLSADLTTIAIEGERIWLGAHDGLRSYDLDGKLLEHFIADAEDSTALPSNSIKGVFIDSLRNMWIGTWGGGLSRYDAQNKRFETFTTRHGLSSNVVYGVIADRRGTLWMGTNHGLAAYEPSKKVFSNFDVSDGFQREYNTGAYFRSVNGVAYFGGVRGLNIFKPENILGSEKVSDVFLTYIQANETSLKDHVPDDVIQLDWQDDDLTLHFAAIDFNAAHKYQFQYSINGDAWRSLGSSRRLDLPELAVGKYEIRVRASINGRTWTDGNVIASINVSAPFWQRPSSYFILAVLLATLTYVAHRIRLRRLQRSNELLNKVVDERTREVKQKSEKILEQNEELLNQTEELTSKNIQLEKTRIELEAFQAELEKRVDERTHDIQALNRELLHQNAQLEQYSFITAHNFRGPVARIKGLIDLLGHEGISTEEFSDIVRFLRSSIQDLDKVISDLNALLVLKEKGKKGFKPVDVRAVMRKVISELEPDLRHTGMLIDTSRFDRHEIRGMDAFFHSIFFNLTENALKYRKPDSVPSLTISCVRKDKKVVMEFSDNGVGIDLALAMPKMFKIYQRFTYGGEGRGLGLYLVKTQTEMMGGEITVESTLGVGTCFRLTFPGVG